MERANIINYLALSANDLISAADASDADTASVLLREATELLALGSVLLHKNEMPKLSKITKEAA